MLITFSLIFLLLSAIFSGTEIAFISASKLRVELKRKKGSRRGEILAGFYDKPAEFLGTLLVGNNIALVVFTYLMNKLLEPAFAPSIEGEALLLLINTMVITIIVLIFGEFFPKTICRLFSDEVLYLLSYPLLLLKYLLLIPSWTMTRLSNILLRFVFKASSEEVDNAITRLDLESYIKDTRTNAEEDIDTELFEKALHLKNVKVKECMVPRPEIKTVEIRSSIDELLEVFKDTNFSRIIVIKEDIDNVMGYVHHQQLLTEPRTIRSIMMNIAFVPEAMRVQDLLNKFIKERNSIACVVDEFGGTAGIITLEDILEEIFGEIEDEHDQEEYVETQISENEYLFSGRLEISYLNEKYENLHFPEGEYHTLSGYIVMTTATIPEQGYEIVLDDYKYILEMVSDKKIELIRVKKLHKNNETQD